MRWGWSGYEVLRSASAGTIDVRDGGGALVVALAVALPGRPAPGFEADDEQLLATVDGALAAWLVLTWGEDSWTLHAGVENRGDEPVEVGPLALSVRVGDDYAGWVWTSDVDGLLVVSPRARAGLPLVWRLRQGFWQTPDRPVFTPAPGAGDAVYALAPPDLRLRPHRRHLVALRAEGLPGGASASELPQWVPGLVTTTGTEVDFRTPDAGVVGGPDVEVSMVDGTATALGPAGHREVYVHDVRGVHRLDVAWAPRLSELLPVVAEELLASAPGARSSAAGAVVAEASARNLVADPLLALDWLEREDWLQRGDLLGIAVAASLAAQTEDRQLLDACADRLAEVPVTPGYGFVVMRAWLAGLSMGEGVTPERGRRLLARGSSDPLTALELSLLDLRSEESHGPHVQGLLGVLGGSMPGRPVELSAADAARTIGLLRLCPEGWQVQPQAVETAEKATRLLLADYADGLQPEWDGLAWLLLSDLEA